VKPSVTVVTPTWRRHDELLTRCIPSVREQVYGGHVQHVIVSDGPDPELEAQLEASGFLSRSRTVYAQLERTRERKYGAWARRRGCELATGELVAYCDDDDALRRNHLERLVAALEESGAYLAYSKMQVHQHGRPSHVIGAEPPLLGRIGVAMVHRAQLLDTATWGDPSYIEDWRLIDRWLEAGATWVFVPEVTYDYFFAEKPVRRKP
jgi:glycosyltransferase involved in cell wall biosynthesis